ncbi:MAG TPA: helix-turn-helix domain-containing protein, partial [Kofleriaceae bacterium]|nr:helix-turn-helix domain-containing protein [Kofleriaceae bacterium]
DCADAAVEVRAARAAARAAAGDLTGACQAWSEIVTGRRARGDELGALRVELEWAEVLERRGELAAAAQLAASIDACAARLELGALRARAAAVAAAIDAAASRRPAVTDGDAPLRRRIAGLAARGENRGALELARDGVAAADRMGNAADLADALAWCARLELAGGDRRAAELIASRAAREAAAAGATWARCTSLLVLAAVAREQGDVVAASSYARDAAEVAALAGLPVERVVAERALAAIADAGGRSAPCSAEATLGDLGRAAAARALADLGLSTMRPFRVVGCDGQESRVADASPERLGLAARDLVVDGVREAIVRGGRVVADLRRRSLLKRLLFLFAAQPGRVFSKEEIVQTVWTVEYHPLRHDAALFTNIMRIRRLLGRDGADLIRVNEEGYRFTPAPDFLFVEPVGG